MLFGTTTFAVNKLFCLHMFVNMNMEDKAFMLKGVILLLASLVRRNTKTRMSALLF